MKYIFLNLKRFDIPKRFGGINMLCPIGEWGETVIKGIDESIGKYDGCEFVSFLPEAHLIPAVNKAKNMKIGSQGVYFDDVQKDANFGAFTTLRTAKAMKALGCFWTIIGHCEERNYYKTILGKGADADNINDFLNRSIIKATQAGLKVLYCIGETADEQDNKYKVLKKQIEIGLNGVDTGNIVIGYEPVWAIGPGKTPPDQDYISDMSSYIKSAIDVPVVYGGGLKQENAAMLASIDMIDGGLIALTRFKGDIGFYPEEYVEIVDIYMKGVNK